MTGLWTLNGYDLYGTYGACILKGCYLDIMAPATPRTRLEHEQLDADGMQVDTTSPLYYQQKKYNLELLIVGSNFADFWAKYNAFFAAISTPGAFTLYVADLGVTVQLLYEGATCLKKPRSLRSGRVAVSYKIAVKEFNPQNRVYDAD